MTVSARHQAISFLRPASASGLGALAPDAGDCQSKDFGQIELKRLRNLQQRHDGWSRAPVFQMADAGVADSRKDGEVFL